MKVTAKVAGYEIRDVIRSRWLIGYTLFFLVITDALFRFHRHNLLLHEMIENNYLFPRAVDIEGKLLRV